MGDIIYLSTPAASVGLHCKMLRSDPRIWAAFNSSHTVWWIHTWVGELLPLQNRIRFLWFSKVKRKTSTNRGLIVLFYLATSNNNDDEAMKTTLTPTTVSDNPVYSHGLRQQVSLLMVDLWSVTGQQRSRLAAIRVRRVFNRRCRHVGIRGVDGCWWLSCPHFIAMVWLLFGLGTGCQHLISPAERDQWSVSDGVWFLG